MHMRTHQLDVGWGGSFRTCKYENIDCCDSCVQTNLAQSVGTSSKLHFFASIMLHVVFETQMLYMVRMTD